MLLFQLTRSMKGYSMQETLGHLLIQIDQPIYDHLRRLADEKQLPVNELVNRFILLGITEDKKGPLYFEDGGKKRRVNLYASAKKRS
jgi:hypothetical protein